MSGNERVERIPRGAVKDPAFRAEYEAIEPVSAIIAKATTMTTTQHNKLVRDRIVEIVQGRLYDCESYQG
jgi:hypothetical protein